MTEYQSGGELIKIAPFSRLQHLLNLSPPTLTPQFNFQQLDQISRYVGELGCSTVVIEERYIDRDYMEDYSVFYSRNFEAPENYCRRLSFFSCTGEELKGRIQDIFEKVAALPPDERSRRYRSLCRQLSRDYFLGFTVIRPLATTPVGRTALRPPMSTELDFFDSTLSCSAHLLGIEFTVSALPFQQQDVGVSACATTALWSSLQKMKGLEDVGPTTPAQITVLANQFRLPFGRSMPSEGLSIDQMCQAIRALGASPALVRLPRDDFYFSIATLYSATRSGFAPVLILQDPDKVGHAVTVAGMRLNAPSDNTPIVGPSIFEEARRLRGLFVHDDRYQPYYLALVEPTATRLEFQLPRGSADDHERRWTATHMLLPLHNKIRLSLGGLRIIALRLAERLVQDSVKHGNQLPRIDMSCWISRAVTYMNSFITSPQPATHESVTHLTLNLQLPRYVGIIQFNVSSGRRLDVLVDTTSTDRNVNILAIIAVNSPLDDPLAATLFEATGVPHFLSLVSQPTPPLTGTVSG